MSVAAFPAVQGALSALLMVVVGAGCSVRDTPLATDNSSRTTEAVALSDIHTARFQRSCMGSRKDPGGPDPWGACWPGPHNTGIPTGTTLTAISGDRTIDTDGTVVDGLDVDGCINVSGLDVTIQNSRARCITLVVNSRARYCHPDESGAVRELTGCTVVPGLSDAIGPGSKKPRLTIRNSTIDCGEELGATGIGDRNINALRVDIHGCENGFDADSYLKIRHSYIHDLYNSAVGDPHTDGLQSGVGKRLRLVHNVFYGFTTGCTYPQDSGSCNGSSAITIGGQRDLVTVSHTLVRRNLLAGGSYTLYCPILAPKGFAIIENRFSEAYSPKVGEYGPMIGCGRQGITRSGNKRIHY